MYIDLVIVLYVRLTVIYKLVCSKTMTNLHLEDPKPKVVNENRLDARNQHQSDSDIDTIFIFNQNATRITP